MKELRVLLVDDSAEFLDSASQFLSRHHELRVVGQARSGAEALRLVGEVSPDLVLVDLAMPRMNGIETTRRIKANSGAPRVVVLTFHTGIAYRTAAIEAGADGFIRKDEFADSLPTLLERLAEGKRSVNKLEPAETVRSK